MADSQGPVVNAVAVLFAVVSVITISVRLSARILVVKYMGPDDSVSYGLGSHIAEVEARGPENMTTYMQIVWLSSIFYNACLGFIKVSVLAFYVRLGDVHLRRLAVVMLGVVVCQAGANVLACIFQCSPVQAAYDVSIPPEDARCVDINAFYLANAAVNILTDILTYTLPLPLVARLQVPKRQKVGLAVMLCLGLFACVSSIVRITYVPPMLNSDDPTFVIAGAMYWSVIETNVGILAASIPSFKALVKRYAPRLLGSYHDVGPSDRCSGRGFLKKKLWKSRQSIAMNSEENYQGDVELADRWMDQTTSSDRNERKDRKPGEGGSEEVFVSPDGRIEVRPGISHTK